MPGKKKSSSGKKAPSKITSRKQNRKTKGKKPAFSSQLKKILILLVVLIAVCLALAIIAKLTLKQERAPYPVQKESASIQPVPEDIIIPEKEKQARIPAPKMSPAQKAKKPGKQQKPTQYEVFKDIHQGLTKKPIFKIKDKIPRIAIIIDDIGYDTNVVNKLLKLDTNITFALLPFSPFGKKISHKLYSAGAEIMLHLPMEPVSYPKNDPGPGVLLSDMSPDTLLKQLKNNLDDIPHISGVNNHMGSELTTHADQMNQIFSILKKNNLFYIDSRTSLDTKAWPAARLLRLRFAQRDVFLDNNQNIEYISGQIHELVRLAHKDGYAIGIGHPYKSTIQALSRELPKLKNRVYLVRVSELTAVPE
jgi:uncharacterized protein